MKKIAKICCVVLCLLAGLFLPAALAVGAGLLAGFGILTADQLQWSCIGLAFIFYGSRLAFLLLGKCLQGKDSREAILIGCAVVLVGPCAIVSAMKIMED